MLKRIRAQEKNVLLVSGGDVFTGTLWYQVYRGNATSRFMNELGYDAVVCDISKFVLACVQKSAISSRMLIRPCLVKSCLKNELSAFRLQPLTNNKMLNARIYEYINVAKREKITKMYNEGDKKTRKMKLILNSHC